MADTEFKIFAQLLATKYRKSRKAEDFAQELFKEIYLPETENNPVEDTLPRTYRGYYSGQNDISELASQIAGFLDTATPKKMPLANGGEKQGDAIIALEKLFGAYPIDKIFQLYQSSPKQIFVVFDKKDAFTQTTQDIIEATTVIELHENGGKLFGWSWAKKRRKCRE